jgi:hypothetical protein
MEPSSSQTMPCPARTDAIFGGITRVCSKVSTVIRNFRVFGGMRKDLWKYMYVCVYLCVGISFHVYN